MVKKLRKIIKKRKLLVIPLVTFSMVLSLAGPYVHAEGAPEVTAESGVEDVFEFSEDLNVEETVENPIVNPEETPEEITEDSTENPEEVSEAPSEVPEENPEDISENQTEVPEENPLEISEDGIEELSVDSDEIIEISEYDEIESESDENPDDLMNEFIDREIDNLQNPVYMATDMAGNGFDGVNKVIYYELRKRITDITYGRETNLEIEIPFSDDWLVDQQYYTKEELGVSSLIEGTNIPQETQRALNQKYNLDIGNVIRAVKNDCPQETFWLGLSNYYGCAYVYKDSRTKVGIKNIIIHLTVNSSYSKSDGSVDSTKLQRINTAITNINEILNEAKNLNDRGKLDFYRDKICELTDYNHPAAESDSSEYGDPWQLIYVFDGDDNTKVVCEGYSKAFLTLCSHTTFLNTNINCYIVSGVLYTSTVTGNHMWNIVHYSDGNNYLVDITNYDSTNFNAFYFCDQSNVVIESLGESYTVQERYGSTQYSFTFTYDSQTLSLYSTEDLDIANFINDSDNIAVNYDLNVAPGIPTKFHVSVNGHNEGYVVLDSIADVDNEISYSFSSLSETFAIESDNAGNFSVTFPNKGRYILLFMTDNNLVKRITVDVTADGLEVEYNVEHYFQTIYQTYSDNPSRTETYTGCAGTPVTPEPLTMEGFNTPEKITETINADGTTVISYFYTRKSYSLTWDFDGGTALGGYTRGGTLYGKPITAPTPSKRGYTFDGWDITVPATMPAKNLKIKARWKIDYATVTLDVNGGKALSSTTVKVPKYTAYGDLPTTSRAGYKFDGWYTAKTGGSKVTSTTTCEGNITLYAHWSAKTDTAYKVEHYLQKLDGKYNSTPDYTDSLKGTTDTTVTPSVKTYTGFTAPEVQTATVNADGTTVVKYLYTRNSYKLTWDFAGGSASGTYTKGTVKYGAAITKPVPVKAGYTFNGWSVSVPATMPAKNLTVKALWKVEEKAVYKVEHYKENLDGKYNSTPDDSNSFTEVVGKSVTPEVKSYTGFTAPEVQTATVNADGTTVVKYLYTRNSYKLTWDFAGGSASGTYTKGTVKYGAAITKPVPVKKGYVFDKWNNTVSATMPAKNVKYIAVWKEASAEDYATVKFDINKGDKITGESTIKVQKGFEYGTLPTATRAGYKFVGWYTERLKGTLVTASTICNESTTLYARWEANEKVSYKVEHYLMDTKGQYPSKPYKTETKSCLKGQTAAPEPLTLTGFTSPKAKKVTISKKGIVIKYTYSRNKYELKWNLDGGTATGKYTKGSVYYGTKIKAPVPVKNGYVFTGWNKTVAAEMPAKAVTYKARWRKLTQEEQVSSFVERFYDIILERPSDPNGIKAWTDSLISKKNTGADVAAGFINSGEFQGRKMSNEEYLDKMYAAFFNREPDKKGYDIWLNLLNNGTSRDEVLRGFINSEEFKNLCNSYGINPGSY